MYIESALLKRLDLDKVQAPLWIVDSITSQR